jgi:hypothetical protein
MLHHTILKNNMQTAYNNVVHLFYKGKLYTNQCICFILKNASQAFPDANALDIFLCEWMKNETSTVQQCKNNYVSVIVFFCCTCDEISQPCFGIKYIHISV